MITNKDIRVENGYLIINGDKFPLDGQSPEAIMDIVESNSDTTPTENSTAPVTSGGVKTALDTINDLLLPISGVLKRFNIDSPNRTIDTGINFNIETTKGFIAVVSSYGSYNAGLMNVYIGGVPHNKQDGTIGDLKVEKLGGVPLGGDQTAGNNATFSIVDDTLRISSPSNQGGLRITMILTTDEIPTP